MHAQMIQDWCGLRFLNFVDKLSKSPVLPNVCESNLLFNGVK